MEINWKKVFVWNHGQGPTDVWRLVKVLNLTLDEVIERFHAQTIKSAQNMDFTDPAEREKELDKLLDWHLRETDRLDEFEQWPSPLKTRGTHTASAGCVWARQTPS